MVNALLGFMCCCPGATAALAITAPLLRLTIWATNKLLGTAKAPSLAGIPEWDWDDWDDGYARASRRPRRTGVIPDAGFGKCAGIVFATDVVFGLGFAAVEIVSEEVLDLPLRGSRSHLAVAVLNLPVAYAALTLLLRAALPTHFWRAALIAFVYGIVLLAMSLSVGVALFALGAALD